MLPCVWMKVWALSAMVVNSTNAWDRPSLHSNTGKRHCKDLKVLCRSWIAKEVIENTRWWDLHKNIMCNGDKFYGCSRWTYPPQDLEVIRGDYETCTSQWRPQDGGISMEIWWRHNEGSNGWNKLVFEGIVVRPTFDPISPSKIEAEVEAGNSVRIPIS